MTATTTNLYPEDGFQIQRSAWEALMLNYLLLPALGAVFLFAVVLIIAFVFIKKKSPVGDSFPEKSGHTIESFNEASDISIYDVINETQDAENAMTKTASRNAAETPQDDVPNVKSRGIYSLASCWGVKGNLSCKTVVLKSVTSLASSESKYPHSVPKRLQKEESHNEGNRGSTTMSVQLEGRIYESLDRHWKAKRGSHLTESTEEHDASESIDFLSSHIESDRQNMEPKAIRNKSPDECIKTSVSYPSKVLDIQHSKVLNSTSTNTAGTEFKHCEKPNGQTICKMSFIPVSEASVNEEQCRARTFYYVIQNKGNKELPADEDGDYIAFPATDSVCLQFSPNPDNSHRLLADNASPNSLNLMPLTNPTLIGLFKDPALLETSPKITNVTKSADQSYLFEAVRAKQSSKSTSYKKRLLKKSESFSETGTGRPNESVRKFSLGAISFKQSARSSDGKQNEKMDKTEVARILTKLGPLPPIPHSSTYDEKPTYSVTSDFKAALKSDVTAAVKVHGNNLKRSKGLNPVFTAEETAESNDGSSGTCFHPPKDVEEQHGPCESDISCDNLAATLINHELGTHRLTDANGVMLCHSVAMEDNKINENCAAKGSNHYFILESGQDPLRRSPNYGSGRALSENSCSNGSDEDINGCED